MKISYQWLCEILPGLNQYAASVVAQKLTFSGLEVEAQEDLEYDVIFEVNITPNRGDALSHWGVACDVAALFGLNVSFDILFPKNKTCAAEKKLIKKEKNILKHEDTRSCSRFTVSQILSVKVSPSPAWLAQRIENLGIRSINNIVDATNYIMLLTGHPVHAYDSRDVSDQAGNQTLIVKTLSTHQSFKTLDGTQRELIAGDLVIADAARVVGLAGIMGGENSEIKNDTKDILLEVAAFDSDVIRKTAKRLGLQTDSSYRFERFVNPETVLKAHEMLRDLIFSLAGTEKSEITEILDSYPNKLLPVKINLPRSEISRVLGIEIEASAVHSILQSLGCDVSAQGENLDVIAPLSRSDLKRPIDLIEELARVHGLEKIPAVMPALKARSPKESRTSVLSTPVKQILVAFGFHETVHYSFTDAIFLRSVLEPKNEAEWIQLKNPIAEDMGIMRPSLLPQLLQCYQKNHLLSEKGMRFFEMRRVYHFDEKKNIQEKLVLAGLFAGNPFGRNRFGMTRESDFFEGKGFLQKIFLECRVHPEESEHRNWPFHPGQASRFQLGGLEAAVLGGLHPRLLQNLKIKEKLTYFEINFDILAEGTFQEPFQFKPVNVLPAVYRDLTLVVPKALSYQDIEKTILREKPSFLKHFQVVDLYTGSNIPSDKKSISLSMSYEPNERNLSDEEVNEMHFELVDKLKNLLGVELR